MEQQHPAFQQQVHDSFPGDSMKLVDDPLAKPHPVNPKNSSHLHLFVLFFRSFDYQHWHTDAAVPGVRKFLVSAKDKRALNSYPNVVSV